MFQPIKKEVNNIIIEYAQFREIYSGLIEGRGKMAEGYTKAEVRWLKSEG